MLNVQDITHAAMNLSLADRMQVLDSLVATMESDGHISAEPLNDVELTIEQRFFDALSGKIETYPAQDMLDRLRSNQ